MASDFFNYTVSKGHKVYAYEFGNELAGSKGIEAQITPQQYALDFMVFVDLVRQYFGSGPDAPRLVTPDGTFDPAFLSSFLSLLTDEYKPDIVTHHLYSLGAGNTPACATNALTPRKLDSIKTTAAQVNTTVSLYSPQSEQWVGE